MTNTSHLRHKALPGLLILLAATVLLSSCALYDISISSYDPENAYNGLTFFTPFRDTQFHIIDMVGNPVFDFDLFGPSTLDADFEVLDDGGILILSSHAIYKFRLPDTIEWYFPAPDSHHCAIQIPNGNIMYIFSYSLDVAGWDSPFLADGIREVNPHTWEIVWEWLAEDHLSTDDYCLEHLTSFYPTNQNYDWTHSNTIIYPDDEDAVYLNIRHLDRFLKIDYPSGEILWSMGKDGDFGEGLFSHSHDPEILESGRILMYDNGNHKEPVEYSRAVEIAYNAEYGWAGEVWAWPDEPQFFDYAMGDANRLPNGNTLITSAIHGRLIEVTLDKRIVWDMQLIPVYESARPLMYKCERIVIP